jgi:hypothetical protein
MHAVIKICSDHRDALMECNLIQCRQPVASNQHACFDAWCANESALHQASHETATQHTTYIPEQKTVMSYFAVMLCRQLGTPNQLQYQ